MALRTMVLELDEDDDATIVKEIADRQWRHQQIGGTEDTLLPEGESNLEGGILAECIRDLNEYRAMWEAANLPKAKEGA